MLEHMEKRPTEQITLTFVGPADKSRKAIEAMTSLGFVDSTNAIPWRDAFPEYADNMPGTALAGARGKEELTQRQLYEKTGIPQRHISEMENGKRPIGKKTARILAKALNVSYKIFL